MWCTPQPTCPGPSHWQRIHLPKIPIDLELGHKLTEWLIRPECPKLRRWIFKVRVVAFRTSSAATTPRRSSPCRAQFLLVYTNFGVVVLHHILPDPSPFVTGPASHLWQRWGCKMTTPKLIKFGTTEVPKKGLFLRLQL